MGKGGRKKITEACVHTKTPAKKKLSVKTKRLEKLRQKKKNQPKKIQSKKKPM